MAFASIGCVLFIFWSWSSISLKEVIRTPFSGLFYPGGCIRIVIDIGFHCDHFLLVTNCKFNTLALIFASIRCVLFICWSLFSSTWKEVIRNPFNRLSYPGRLLILILTLDFMYWINNSWYLTANVFQHRRSSGHVFLNDFICDTLKSRYGMYFIKLFINFQPGNVSYRVF